MSGYVIVQPLGGLGNRLLALTSALRLANLWRRPFKVCWEPDEHCFAEFHELFDFPVPLVSASAAHRGMKIADVTWFMGGGGFLHTPNLEEPPPGQDIWIRSQLIVCHSAESRANHFYSFDSVIFDLWKWFYYLEPCRSIIERANAFDRVRRHRTVTVHIRRVNPKDVGLARHFDAMVHSAFPTDDDYTRIMSSMLACDNNIQFFVATNGAETENRLRSEFGDKVIIRAKESVDRSLKAVAIQEAMVDLILMSRTSLILRYFWSSFPYFASIIGWTDTAVIMPDGDKNGISIASIRMKANQTVETTFLKHFSEILPDRVVP